MLCDVNRLSQINDQYGHPAGDACLKEVAQILAYMIREEDILGRCGGDDFFIFMPNCEETRQTEEICERIENRFRLNGGKGKHKIALSVTAVSVLRQPGVQGAVRHRLLPWAGRILFRQPFVSRETDSEHACSRCTVRL